MNYKHLLFFLLLNSIAFTGFSQSDSQLAHKEAKSLKVFFELSDLQEGSLAAALVDYYSAKTSFLQRTNRTSDDTKNLQKQHDNILKRIFTAQQYKQYEAVKEQQLQIMRQRIDSGKTNIHQKK